MRYSILSRAILCLCSLTAVAAAPHATTYDFIVVGGGTGGIAVATRLSQYLPKSSVLLIEAGPDGRNESKIYIPGLKGSALSSKYDWNFTTTLQPEAGNRSLKQNRGHVLGGSSALNLLSWDRGATADYDAWEELGNPGWGAAAMFPAMQRAETYQSTSVKDSAGITGTGKKGPIHFLLNRWSPPQQEAFFPTMQSLGLKQTFGFLSGQPLGWMRHTSNILLGNYTRSYSPAYLAHAETNLHVMTDTRVAKINIDSAKCATGVTLSDGTVLRASKEVILSAGSIQSPQLLELSGIGSKKVLKAAGIKPLVALPGVGENLQDHIRIVTAYQLRPNYTSPDILKFNASYAATELANWKANISSLYDSTSSGYVYTTWDKVVSTDSAFTAAAKASANPRNAVDQRKLANLLNKKSGTAQLEVLFSDGYLGNKGYPANTSSLYGQQFFAIIGVIMHPYSRGSVHINSSSVDAHPVLDPKYLSKPYDVLAITEAAKYIRKVAETPPLSYAWSSEYEPGLDVVKTDAQWEAFARANVQSIWHPLGSCAMLPKKDGGVVSPELKVYGVDRLRVVDASIIPALVSGHLQTAVYGVAEMAAKMIAKEWK